MIIRFFLHFKLFLFSFLILCSFYKPESSHNKDFTTVNYLIKKSSTLSVNCKTNLNTFCCTSQEKFEKKSLEYKFNQNINQMVFENTILNMQINQLDCGNRFINKDMHKTLRAKKHPNITLTLKEANVKDYNILEKCNEWIELIVNADFTITNNTQTFKIPVRAKKLDINSYRISGETSLQLCDFGIKSPTALLGLVKVEDEIEISFDLYVEVK